MWDAHHWNATDDERHRPLPSDDYLPPPVQHVHRAVDVDAPIEVTFRWLCQLSVAPSRSADFLDPGEVFARSLALAGEPT